MNSKPAQSWRFSRSPQLTVNFEIKKCYLLEIQLRTKRDSDGGESEYAVLKVGTLDLLDEFQSTGSASRKVITLMCFEPSIYFKLQDGDWYRMKGFVSFGYGNTYLCITEAFDSLYRDVEEVFEEDKITPFDEPVPGGKENEKESEDCPY